MENVYLQEAFKALDILNEEDFNLSSMDGLTDAKEFIDKDEKSDFIDIIDPEATTEEEIKDSYVGNVILDCTVCHSKLYKNPEEVHIDEEEGFANIDEECPFCYSTDGYTIIGQVAPYGESSDEEEDEDEEEIEVKENETETVEEGIFNKKQKGEATKSFSVSTIGSGHFRKYAFRDNNGRELGTADNEKKAKALASELRQQGYKDADNFLGESLDEGIGGALLGGAGGALLGGAALGPLGAIGGAALGGLTGNALTKDKQEDLEEDVDISEYQKWVDYDMKKYGRISFATMKKIKKAGFSVVKDQYGDYEVIADRADESLKEDVRTDKYREYLYNKIYDYEERFSWLSNRIESLLDKFTTSKDQYLDSLSFEELKNLNKEIDKIILADKRNEYDESLKEHFEKVEIETEDQKMEMTAEDDGKVTVVTEPKEEGEEVLEPVSDEVQTELNVTNDEETEDGFEDVDINEFSEEEFDELGESYLKKIYENVNSFKTSSIMSADNKLVVEGIIGFNSGKQKKTSFVFESKDITKRGKVRFIGENLQMSKGKKSFTLCGKINEGKFIAESLNYNYRAKDSEGKSTRLYGTVKVNKQ